MANKIEIYIRPKTEPQLVTDDENVRVNYRNYWVDFRDGLLIIRDENGIRIHTQSLP